MSGKKEKSGENGATKESTVWTEERCQPRPIDIPVDKEQADHSLYKY